MDEENSTKIGYDEFQLVVFNLGDEAFGVDIAQVREIIKMSEITRMPDAPQFVEGIINLRGQITTIMDLRKKLGVRVSETNEQTRIIIVEARDTTLGMIVDSVSEVLRLSGKDLDSTPSTLSKYNSEFIQGVGKIDEGLLILLDLNKVLSEKEISQIKKMPKKTKTKKIEKEPEKKKVKEVKTKKKPKKKVKSHPKKTATNKKKTRKKAKKSS